MMEDKMDHYKISEFQGEIRIIGVRKDGFKFNCHRQLYEDGAFSARSLYSSAFTTPEEIKTKLEASTGRQASIHKYK